MKKLRSNPQPSEKAADEIAGKASRGEGISSFFTGHFTLVKPVRRVNIDLIPGMLRKLDERAALLNVSRRAVIKTLLDRALEDTPVGKA